MAFIATDSYMCFQAGCIYSYVKIQRAPRVEHPHLYESFRVALSLEGSAMDTLASWGRWVVFRAADRQLSPWAQRTAFFLEQRPNRGSHLHHREVGVTLRFTGMLQTHRH